MKIKKLNAGIIGLGVGERHITGYKSDQRCDIKKLCDFDREKISVLSKKYPEYEFTTTDQKVHEIWLVNQPNNISKVIEESKFINNIYIADGHHRIASSSIYQKSKTNQLLSNYFLSFLIDQKELKIFETIRQDIVVKNMVYVSSSYILSKLKNKETKKLFNCSEDNIINVLNIYKKPSKKSEIVSQMIFGDSFSIIRKFDQWIKIKTKETRMPLKALKKITSQTGKEIFKPFTTTSLTLRQNIPSVINIIPIILPLIGKFSLYTAGIS